jgi:polyphosphate kinase 2 (PPK2 family)
VVQNFNLQFKNKQQTRRFLERIDDPLKNWKFSSNDANERDYWDDYMDAYEEMIQETATKEAPWYVVPADNKWFTRVIVASAVIETLDSLDLAYPKVDDRKLKELASAKKKLLSK